MRPNIITKPWGWEEIWGDVPGKYLGKTIHINMNNFLPLQYNKEKEETIYVMRGVLTLVTKELQTIDNRMPNKELFNTKQKLGPGECFHIEAGKIHRFHADKGDVALVKVSTYHLNDTVTLS